MSLLDSGAVFLFNLVLVLCTLPAYAAAKLGVLFARPQDGDSQGSWLVFVLISLGWRLLFALCRWVQVRIVGLEAFRAKLRSSGRPAIIIANHSSFLDTILLVSCLPLSQVYRVKMFVSSHLFKMPLLSSIVAAMGHLAVPFKASPASDSFELDKELMAKRQLELERHVRAGNIAGWFPEGRMNPGDEAEVGLFRAGGFALASRIDVEIWCVSFRGMKACWPRTSAVGGRPASIGVEFFKLCDSSLGYLAAAPGGPPAGERERTIFLADSARARIQASVNQLAGVTQRNGQGDLREPLLPS